MATKEPEIYVPQPYVPQPQQLHGDVPQQQPVVVASQTVSYQKPIVVAGQDMSTPPSLTTHPATPGPNTASNTDNNASYDSANTSANTSANQKTNLIVGLMDSATNTMNSMGSNHKKLLQSFNNMKRSFQTLRTGVSGIFTMCGAGG